MPYLLVRSNQTIAEKDRQQLLADCSTEVAEMLGKPERYVMVSLDLGVDMTFAGDTSPCAYLELKSIGLPEAQTASYSAQLCRLIGHRLNIPAERIYIEFAAAARHMWGWDERTF